MADKRVIRATKRAVPLLTDIVDSTAYLYAAELPGADFTHIAEMRARIRAELVTADFLIGFEDNMPFGFVGVEKIEACARLVGPYLYREYLGNEYGKFLLDFALKLARSTGLNPMFTLVHKKAIWAINFFSRWGFEQLSDQKEFIRRWHDGILAAYPLPANSILMVRLLDEASASAGSPD